MSHVEFSYITVLSLGELLALLQGMHMFYFYTRAQHLYIYTWLSCCWNIIYQVHINFLKIYLIQAKCGATCTVVLALERQSRWIRSSRSDLQLHVKFQANLSLCRNMPWKHTCLVFSFSSCLLSLSSSSKIGSLPGISETQSKSWLQEWASIPW